MDWTVAPVTAKCAGKDGPIDHVVAGWVKGPFGLDFRVFEDEDGEYLNPGFVITHLPTGMVVRQLVSVGMAEAKALADEILDSADWTFTGKPAAEHRVAVQAIMQRHKGKVATGHSLIGPGA